MQLTSHPVFWRPMNGPGLKCWTGGNFKMLSLNSGVYRCCSTVEKTKSPQHTWVKRAGSSLCVFLEVRIIVQSELIPWPHEAKARTKARIDLPLPSAAAVPGWQVEQSLKDGPRGRHSARRIRKTVSLPLSLHDFACRPPGWGGGGAAYPFSSEPRPCAPTEEECRPEEPGGVLGHQETIRTTLKHYQYTRSL